MHKAISVVIPTYNGQQLLETHLPAVLNCLRDGDEIVIVDDASTDTTLEWLTQVFDLQSAEVEPNISDLPKTYKPTLSQQKLHVLFGKIEIDTGLVRIVVVANQKNMRFAATANIGVALASHDLVLLLNSDVSPTKNVLDHLVPHFDDESVFAVGCIEYKNEDAHRHNSAQKAGKNKLWFERGIFMHNKADSFDTGPTAWVSGGSGLFHKKKWLALSGFDLRFAPAYWEDVDLSFRARTLGWQVLFDAQAVVYHNHETTNIKAFGEDRMDSDSWANGQKFTWKNGTLLQRILFIVWWPYWWWRRRQVS